jgi:hypothetical protein
MVWRPVVSGRNPNYGRRRSYLSTGTIAFLSPAGLKPPVLTGTNGSVLESGHIDFIPDSQALKRQQSAHEDRPRITRISRI